MSYYNICKITDLEEIRVNHVNHPKSRIKGEIRFEFNIIQKNHLNNIDILIKTNNVYKETSETVKQILDIR